MSNHTAQDLLAAVGVDWKADPKFYAWDNGLTSTQIYTGPALNTPELDAVLWVEGQRWLFIQQHDVRRAVAKNLAVCGFEENEGGWVSGRLGLLFQDGQPGHALAAAIAEVASC
jgi:hypothetical protein